jgi:phosphoribosylamine--glycine ligase
MKIVGPTAAAARLEGSKIFAKRFFERAGIPTARSVQTGDTEEALAALRSFRLPVVIKADGLAAGKGVIIAQDEGTARRAVEQLGPALVIEEFLEGEEVSFIGLTNGQSIVAFAPTQDHKRAFDGDTGPNTGGMGAYCDNRILTAQQTGIIMDRIMQPAVAQMAKDGSPFTGFLYAGLMMTAAGPKILEFNVRLGDPETQALMYGFDGGLGELLMRSTSGGGELSISASAWSKPSACVVLSSYGYPETPRTGDSISGIEAAEATGAVVFHAGTKQTANSLVTSGGRVLGVTAGGENLQSALDGAYRASARIHFEGMHYRRDIGHKGLERYR